MNIYGVVGWKNAGKTTLMERLVAEITSRGLTVSTIKHAHHAFDVDTPGKDSYRHRAAGASEVLVSSGARWAVMAELRDADEPPLADLLTKLSPVDLVLIEGYKRDRHPKVEAHRATTGAGLIAADDNTIRAIATNDPVETTLPCLSLDDAASVADFILTDLGIHHG
jgi:molybdopterin-guanine dinucleotide biosynthesis protein MobB